MDNFKSFIYKKSFLQQMQSLYGHEHALRGLNIKTTFLWYTRMVKGQG